MLPGRLAEMPPSPFTRLRELLSGIEPGKPEINLTIGEPRDPPPEFVLDVVRKSVAEFGKYPPIQGTELFRASCANWAKRRFHLPDSAVNPETQILPLNGSREGLFYAPFVLTPEKKANARPVFLVPNPFYATYPTSTLSAGAEPCYVPVKPETGFLPDFWSVPKAILERTVAAFFCSPSNPEGATADADYWQRLFALADQYDFTVLADECYTDLYDVVPPIGAMAVRHAATGGLNRLLSFHSLSKRSNLPGLRSGFVAGPPELIAKLQAFRNTSGVQMPFPTLAASAAAWDDDAHVEVTRARYRERFAAATRLLGNRPGFRLPGGGFYLYLDVGDGPAAAKLLWAKAGVRVLPSAFMSVEMTPGKTQTNPGFPYLRVALVHDLSTIMAALERVAETLEGWG
jgi:aspartate/methionine/tyrosine aminotransferase